MVDDPALQELNTRLPGDFKLAMVPTSKLRLAKKNARYMKSAMFKQLVANVRGDGGLSSVPLCHKAEDGILDVLSGNHRVMAAQEAGIEETLVLYIDRPLEHDELVARQLSHNAISGEDDLLVLRDLYGEIESVALKLYAGLDDKMLAQLDKVNLSGLSEANLDYQLLSFAFLPNELTRVKDAFTQAMEETQNDTALVRWREYDRLLDALAKIKADYHVWNAATALMLVLDVFGHHLEDLRAGWCGEDDAVLHQGWVTLAGIIGTDTVPPEAAAVINRAVQTMVSRGDVSAKAKWQAIEHWAADYLAGPDSVGDS